MLKPGWGTQSFRPPAQPGHGDLLPALVSEDWELQIPNSLSSTLLDQLAALIPANLALEAKQKELQAMLDVVAGIGPQNEAEALLAVQMAGIHVLSMRFMALASQAGQRSGYEKTLNSISKLTRTYAAQLEALKRFRGDPSQKILVEHLHIESGAQAVIGSINKGGG
ncbi:MAG: hypothetical protein H7839_18735 [Magnetococcus sp. YQC-5]